MKNKFASGLVVLLLTAVLVGCGSSSAEAPSSKASDSALDGKATTYPVSVHASNGDVSVPAQPQHIVSLSPTATEMLFAIDAGAQVKAVDSQSTYPAGAPKTSLSGFTPNAEAIAAVQPDLVVLSYDSNGIASQLSKLNIPTLVLTSANSLDDSYSQIETLGVATNHKQRAASVIAGMKADIAVLQKQVPESQRGKSYFHEVDSSYYSLTSKTFAGSIYELAGLRNIADGAQSGNDYPQLSAEKIVASNPNYVFLADPVTASAVASRPGWSNVDAVKSGNVVALDPDIASRWGPRVVDFLRVVVEAEKKAAA
jgi:iron complex transport system substrate-binding protein